MVPDREIILLMALSINFFSRGLFVTAGAVVVASVASYYKDKLGSVLSNAPAEEGPNDNKGLNEKIKALGITEKTCLLENLQSSGECTLNKEQMEKINFFEKTEGQEFPIVGLDGNKTVALKIEKGYDSNDFPETLRFTFRNKNNEDVSLGSDSDKKVLKHNINYDYKFLQSSSQLMKSWTLQRLGDKVGLNTDDSNSNTCDLGEATVNVWRSEGDYVVGAKAKNKCIMDVTKDTEGYLEGFKFTLKEEADVDLTEGEKPAGATVDKLTKTNNTSYEIGMKDVDGTKKWFLIERKN